MATAKLEFGAGLHVSEAAKMLVDAVAHGAEVAEGDFNEITLSATTGTTEDQIVAYYDRESAARADAYRKSPEGIAAAAKWEADTKALQACTDLLMAEFSVLNLKDDVALLDWLDRFTDPSDRSDISADRAKVIEALEAAGYVSGANCGPAFNAEDRDNVTRYLVGQALSGLKSVGAIHQVFSKFHGDWKAKFLAA